MKTVQISDAVWKVLKLESVERGITMREVVNEALATGEPRVDYPVKPVASAQAVAKTLGLKTARELRVELED